MDPAQVGHQDRPPQDSKAFIRFLKAALPLTSGNSARGTKEGPPVAFPPPLSILARMPVYRVDTSGLKCKLHQYTTLPTWPAFRPRVMIYPQED